MSVQTSYGISHLAAIAGMVMTMQPFNTVSRVNKGTSTIPYGLGVFTDGETGAKLPTGTDLAAAFNGVVMYELNRAQADGDVAGATAKQDFTVVTHGDVWVETLDTVAKDDAVYVRVGSTGAGKFSGVIGAGVTLGRLIPNAKFLTGGVAGDLVKISLGLGG